MHQRWLSVTKIRKNCTFLRFFFRMLRINMDVNENKISRRQKMVRSERGFEVSKRNCRNLWSQKKRVWGKDRGINDEVAHLINVSQSKANMHNIPRRFSLKKKDNQIKTLPPSYFLKRTFLHRLNYRKWQRILPNIVNGIPLNAIDQMFFENGKKKNVVRSKSQKSRLLRNFKRKKLPKMTKTLVIFNNNLVDSISQSFNIFQQNWLLRDSCFLIFRSKTYSNHYVHI